MQNQEIEDSPELRAKLQLEEIRQKYWAADHPRSQALTRVDMAALPSDEVHAILQADVRREAKAQRLQAQQEKRDTKGSRRERRRRHEFSQKCARLKKAMRKQQTVSG